MPSFVLNDENQVNSYGFRTKNAGIDLTRFRANPVMLDSHQNTIDGVIGKWENIRIEGALLLADPVFDMDDKRAKAISGKVDRGFIKGASMGFSVLHAERGPDGIPDVVKSEKYESSVCAIPSTANAVRLYAAGTGELLSDEEVKVTLSTLTKDENKLNLNLPNNKMKKLALSAAVLLAVGLTSATVETDEDVINISNVLTNLNAEKAALLADKTDLENKLKSANLKLKDQNEAAAKALGATFVIEGKGTAEMGAQIEKLALLDYEGTAKIVAGMPGKVSLSGQVVTPSGESAEVKTLDDFQKLPPAQQLAFKKDNKAAYDKLFS